MNLLGHLSVLLAAVVLWVVDQAHLLGGHEGLPGGHLPAFSSFALGPYGPPLNQGGHTEGGAVDPTPPSGPFTLFQRLKLKACFPSLFLGDRSLLTRSITILYPLTELVSNINLHISRYPIPSKLSIYQIRHL